MSSSNDSIGKKTTAIAIAVGLYWYVIYIIYSLQASTFDLLTIM